jgi:2-oxoglutarate dehydrogenase E2 component (dihydrolipoamide succinyltransferase)
MSPLRKKIAAQLVMAQQNAAMLTTFNEVDRSTVMQLRSRYQESFQKRHGIKLGFMSFFVKAAVEALRSVPAMNVRLDEDDIIENHFFDVGVAVGTARGLVVPVIREADKKTFAELEQDVARFAAKAREGKLQLDDLVGGVFTITNGGIYGSLLSTPILNPPQSGILGMHKIQNRPVAIGEKIEIRPMMYLALSYDHRVVDGQEAVTFLVRIKDCIEDPMRLLLQG